MYPHLFLTILPALLGAMIAPSLALPVQSSDSVSVEARSFGLSPDASLLVSRDFDAELVVERVYQDDESDVLARSIPRAIRKKGRAPVAKKKLTAAEAQKRKEDKRTEIAKNQVENAAKKIESQAETAKLGPGHMYGKPTRKIEYSKVKTKTGTNHITGGYRKRGREKGFRVAKQPKTPQPNFAKGDHLTNAKAVQKQAEAKARLHAEKTAGWNAHTTAKDRHKLTLEHGNMPNRHDEYNVPNHGVLHGKDVRIGAYNLGMHIGQGGKYPVIFRNHLQTDGHSALPHMVGDGLEYPINNAKKGYHPDAAPGPVRGIYQKIQGGPGQPGDLGYNIQGVVAHDVTLIGAKAEGRNDHHQVPHVLAPVNEPLEGAGDTLFTSHH
ncbi:hypothetical protein BJ912DRAFT_925674 [Pholiota molesta]|nr:hypothetical protein BJ912DRAFT_925674 [Pholiota molesta]